MSRAILFHCHYLNSFIVNAFRQIQNDCPDDDVFMLYDVTRFPIETASPRVFTFQDNEAPKPERGLSNQWYQRDYPLVLFRRQHPEYDYYWRIEYDVRFTGNWQKLFDSAPEGDLVGTQVVKYLALKEWYWWREKDYINVDDQLLIKSFFPLLRLSNRALKLLDHHRSHGIRGFCEWVVPTLLNSSGQVIRDLGGFGDFTPQDCLGRFYSPDTFNWRPLHKQTGQLSNWLYHPVRESLEIADKKEYRIGDIKIRCLPPTPANTITVNGTGFVVFDMGKFYVK